LLAASVPGPPFFRRRRGRGRFLLLSLPFAASMDVRVVAKLVFTKIGEKPADLDSLLESIGVWMGWHEKLQLLQLLPGVEAVYHAVSGKLLVRRVG